MVTLTIDGKVAEVEEGTTILDAARTVGIEIPTLCYLRDLNEGPRGPQDEHRAPAQHA